jgi:hypothetical protein
MAELLNLVGTKKFADWVSVVPGEKFVIWCLKYSGFDL